MSVTKAMIDRDSLVNLKVLSKSDVKESLGNFSEQLQFRSKF